MNEDDIDPDKVDVDPTIAELFHESRISTAIIEDRDEIETPDEFLTRILKEFALQITEESDDEQDDARGFY